MKMLAGLTDTSEDAEPGHVASEATSGIRTVTAFNLQPEIMRRFAVAQQPRATRMVPKAVTAGAGMGSSLFVLFATYGLVFYVGGVLVQAGTITFQAMLQVRRSRRPPRKLHFALWWVPPLTPRSPAPTPPLPPPQLHPHPPPVRRSLAC